MGRKMIKKLKVISVMARSNRVVSKVDSHLAKKKVTSASDDLDFLNQPTENNQSVLEEMRNTIVELQQIISELASEKDRVPDVTRLKMIEDMRNTLSESGSTLDAARHAKLTYDLAFFQSYHDMEFVRLFAQELLDALPPTHHIPLWQKIADGGMARLNEAYSIDDEE